MVRRSTFAALLPLLLGACFPTMHSARIDPGPRIAISVTRLNDQRRERRQQGTDYLTVLDVGYGIGKRLEVGAPFGAYWENGVGNSGEPLNEALYPVIMPYIKLGLLPNGPGETIRS